MDTVKDALTALNTESETGEEIKEFSPQTNDYRGGQVWRGREVPG